MSTDARAPGDGPAPRERRPPGAGPFLVGFVGRAGSGKSTIARALEAGGAIVLDADRLGHEVTDRDPGVRAALIADYGPGVYRPDGSLDRRRVAARVFTDAAALERLNALVHPRILARLRERIAEITAGGFTGLLIVDAALMLDWRFERECDAILAVVAPEAAQVERLVRGRGWSENEAKRRLGMQHPNAWFEAAADVVVVNDGDEAAAAGAARTALERLRALRADGADTP